MTEMTYDQAEALGYDGTQRTDNVAPSMEGQIELMSQRIAELQRINEEKVRTIAEKDDRIVGLINEVERAHESEGIEVQRTSSIKRKFREQIVDWANEYDMTIECLNELLRELGMDPVPESVVAEVEVRLVVRFEAGSGTPAHPDAEWLRQHVEVLLDSSNVRPGYGSSLETLTAEVEGFDVTHVEAT
jgi:hypothetical protein